MSRQILILGGALSGPTAAARAREVDATAEITVIERASDISYAVGGLPYHLSGEVEAANDLAPYRAAFFKRFYNVDIRTGVSVVSIDADARTVTTSDGVFSYDRLIYALGAGSVMPEVFGEGAVNLSLMRNMKHLRGIVSQLEAGAQQVTVVGGGFYGVEAAECLARRGCSVTLIERGPQLLDGFSPAAARRAESELSKLGVTVHTDSAVAEVHREGDRIVALQLADARHETELIIVSAGVRPRTEIFKAAGGVVQEDGSIRVDSHCRTNLKNVFATSICTAHPHAVTGKPIWTAQAADADKTAQVAGANAAGQHVMVGPTLGTAIIRVGSLTLARTGHTGAPDQGSVHLDSHSADPFFRGSASLAITLYFDERSRRVQGAEVVGQAGVDKRIDVIATAIMGKLRVSDLAQLDLAYSPPYSMARDPINAVGNIATQSKRIRAWAPAELDADDTVLRVDLREEEQRTADPVGGLEAALDGLDEHASALKEAGQVVFICESGRVGYLAACAASGMGVRKPGYLSGGVRAWHRSESP